MIDKFNNDYDYIFFIRTNNGETIEHYVCEYSSINSIQGLIQQLMNNEFMVMKTTNRDSYRSVIRADTVVSVEIERVPK